MPTQSHAGDVEGEVFRGVFSRLTVSLQAGAGFFAQDGAKDDGKEKAEEENTGGHQPLVLLEEQIRLDPRRERADVVDVVADAVGGKARAVENADGLADVGGL